MFTIYQHFELKGKSKTSAGVNLILKGYKCKFVRLCCGSPSVAATLLFLHEFQGRYFQAIFRAQRVMHNKTLPDVLSRFSVNMSPEANWSGSLQHHYTVFSYIM